MIIEASKLKPRQKATLVVTRSWDAGWEARLDGAAVPLRRCDLALMAVAVPAGEHTLTLQLADGAHLSYGPAMATTIKVTVK